MPERHSTSTHQDYSSHGLDVVLAVQHGCGVGVEVDIVRPDLPLVHSKSLYQGEPAQLKSPKAPTRGISCLSLVLCGIGVASMQEKDLLSLLASAI